MPSKSDLKLLLDGLVKATPTKTHDEALSWLAGMLIGQFVAYRLYRRLGAPKWAAHGFSTLGAYGKSNNDWHRYRANGG